MRDDEPTLDPEATFDPASSAAPSADDAPRKIGPYRVVGLLGRGGMGEVWRGFDDKLGRPVAIKRVARAARDQPEARARFWREARALAAVDHPGVVQVHRIDETPEGDLYLAMELVEGASLAEKVGDAPWPASAAYDLLGQAASALGAAHAAGLTHRDVKPANLLVDPAGVVKVVDFGLARRVDALEDRVTATGTVLGTPAWMAPEQVAGAPVSPATDVFALGAIGYRLLAGKHPFARESREATALALLAGQVAPLGPLAPQAPPALVAVIEACLARDPSQRPATGWALVDALAALPSPEGPGLGALESRAPSWSTAPRGPSVSGLVPGAGRARLGLGALALVIALSLGGLWLWRSGPPALVLPPRPVVAVADWPGPDGAVDADRVRRALDGAPETALLVSRDTLAAMVGPDAALADVRLADLPAAGAGRVDFLLRAEGEAVVLVGREGVQARWPRAEATPAQIGAALGVAPSAGRQIAAPTAWRHSLAAARAFEQGRHAAHEQGLRLALQADPGFAPARLMELELLRAERRYDALAKRAAPLVEAPYAPRVRAQAAAWLALGQGRSAQTLRALRDLRERWPLDVAAARLQLAIRFNDPEHRDLAKAQRVAESLLAIAPQNEEAASRLVRAMAIREVPGVAARLDALGVPREALAFAEVWGDVALFEGRWADARAAYDRAIAAADGDDLYSVHMRIAADILAGRCTEAAEAALARIDAVEALGRDANLDWTYSLATQALICRQRWPAFERVAARWAERSASGASQVASLRPRVALARGISPEAVAADIQALLADPSVPRAARPSLLRTYARVAADPVSLAAFEGEADQAALDPDRASGRRAAWARAREALALRRRARTDPGPAVLADYAAAVRPVRSEADLAANVEARAAYAEALAEAGQAEAAARIWREIAGLGYARLWCTDVWLLARAQ